MIIKKATYLLLFLSLSLHSNAQQKIHIDEKGDTISETYFQNKWRNPDLSLSRWDSLGENNKRYCKLKKELFLKGTIDYSIIKKELEKIISTNIPDSSTILISYYFKDDLCTSAQNNKWTKEEIKQRKDFLNPIKESLNEKGIVFLCLFEKDMTLKNKPKKSTEYFFLDEYNYFRSNLFSNPTLCGSKGIIIPNGQTLIRNGEYRADWMAKSLEPEIWSQFFKRSEDIKVSEKSRF
ncbi:hypothetical protein [Winogradskyella flava]|uniref:Uncharacterized protein n=1 Tax=Winogradskyella flava TaxID=1884876 RepID=A0A842IMH9_9FLAO|nr:hypothetical protein [Winogradskyella flava]MBC2844452.1 hypothetical protein [Winogradskyella flava]